MRRTHDVSHLSSGSVAERRGVLFRARRNAWAPDPWDSPADDTVDVTTHAIHGGARECGFVAVGALVADGRHCTGTLVAPDVVLTAAHCVTPGLGGTFYTGHAYRRSPGADDFSGMHAHVVREFRVHPDASPR